MPLPDRISNEGFTVLSPSAINLIIGRNGSGKSRMLRSLSGVGAGHLQYITPERGGPLEREAGIENDHRTRPEQAEADRKRNQHPNFKRLSAIRLRDLAFEFMRKVHDDTGGLRGSGKTFESEYLDRLNAMLDNIRVHREGSEFVFLRGDARVAAVEISSGEAELISLASEIYWFTAHCRTNALNVLYLDEPDVHLHPDLQGQVARFVFDVFESLPKEVADSSCVCIATHSTSLLSAFAGMPNVSIGVKSKNDDTVIMRKAFDELPKISPFFGHPLSQILAKDKPVIVEGEDDWRVWQQAERSAQRRLKIYPCVANTVAEQGALEDFCDRIFLAIYDEGFGISIRDGDGKVERLDNLTRVKRFRLACYEIENLLVTDEALVVLGTTWGGLIERLRVWSKDKPEDPRRELVDRLTNSDERLRHEKIKALRDLVPIVMEWPASWEAVVGRAIASIEEVKKHPSQHSIVAYLGAELLSALDYPPLQ